ncbi:MAG: universal stress protein [Acidobacteriota bacterium]
MANDNSTTAIKHIFCPTDLSPNSQKALGFATRLADDLSAQLTACHVLRAQWFSPKIEVLDNRKEIEEKMQGTILNCSGEPASDLRWRASVIDNSFDPSRDILNLAKETKVDLIVMKARPGVMSAFRFGSIVERVVAASPCPVLLFPTRFLDSHEPAVDGLHFERILFDYDFSQATDDLYHVVRSMSDGLSARLDVLSVLEPAVERTPVFAGTGDNRSVLQSAVMRKLDNVLAADSRANVPVNAAVEWGDRAQTVLQYAADHNTDLVCTTLSPPYHSFEKFYSIYLGQLLKTAKCPILVKQSV